MGDNLKSLPLTSGAPLPQSMHSPPKRVLRACPDAHVASGFEVSFRVAGFTKGGTLNGNCCSQAVVLLARAACNAARQPAVLLLVGASPSRSASSQVENILGRGAAAFGLRSGGQHSTRSTQHACVWSLWAVSGDLALQVERCFVCAECSPSSTLGTATIVHMQCT